MQDDVLIEELQELKKQLEQVKWEQEQAARVPVRPADESPQQGIDPEGSPPPEDSEADTINRIKEQIQGTIEHLDENLGEIEPTTLLGVFTLGILLGRVLPR